MHRIDTPTAQQDKFGQGKNGFTNGDPSTGTLATKLNSDIFDALQEELCTVIESSGIRLNQSQHDQLYHAVKKLSEAAANKAKNALIDGSSINLNTLYKLSKALGHDPKFAETMTQQLSQKLAKSENGADIPDPALFIKNLGLCEGSALPVGVPVPWCTAIPPLGWISCNGSTFHATDYPQLAKVYPTLQLPDLRGQFIRGWDNGNNKIDYGRQLLSMQDFAMQEFTGSFGGFDMNNDGLPAFDGPFKAEVRTALNCPNTGKVVLGEVAASFDLARVAKTALETRPCNIAFHYIVRCI